MIQRLFQYLKGTLTIGWIYQGKRDDIIAFSDSSFADCNGSVSTCGYLVRVFGDTVAWKTIKQNFVALSTCEAEYAAMHLACKGVVSINNSISKLLNRSFLPATLRCDNQAAICNAETNGGNKLRHMTGVYRDYIKECLSQNKVKLKWISSKEQLADIMTKPLAFDLHSKLRDIIINISI